MDTSLTKTVIAAGVGGLAAGAALHYLYTLHAEKQKRPTGLTDAKLNSTDVSFRYSPQKPATYEDIGESDPVLKKDAVKKAIYGAPVTGSVILDFDFLEGFMKDVFVSYGVPEADASIAANVLISSDKRGIDSHGIGRLKPIYCDRMDAGILKPHAPMKILKQTKNTAVIDGGGGLGLVIGPKCMKVAIDMAKEHGIGMVCVRNSTHYGFAGYYPLMAVNEGCIGITGTNARPSIAPTYGVQPCCGTNPLVFGMPSADDFPFILDCATSVNQRGKIEKYAREGKPTPAGCVISRTGEELTDSQEILKALVAKTAALTPLGGAGHAMGGYKGYGFAAVVELLCSALQDNKFGADLADSYIEDGIKKRRPSLLGHFFIAINVEAFASAEKFEGRVSEILSMFRESEKDPRGPGRIYTAGEPEHVAWSKRSHCGGTPVPPVLQDQMRQLRDKSPTLRKKFPKLPFE